MPHTEKTLRKHPFANPHRGQHGRSSMFLGVFKLPKELEGRARSKRLPEKCKILMPADAGRWIPHQGEREKARRRARASWARRCGPWLIQSPTPNTT